MSRAAQSIPTQAASAIHCQSRPARHVRTTLVGALAAGLVLASGATPGQAAGAATTGAPTAAQSQVNAAATGPARTSPRSGTEKAGTDKPGTDKAVPGKVTLALTGAKVLMPGSMSIEAATILISGETIAAVGPNLPVPAGVEVQDWTGRVITPGFIEPLSQLGLVEIGAEVPSVDTQVRDQPFVPAFDVQDSFNPRSVHIPITRKGGVTSVLVTPSEGVMAGNGRLARLKGNGNGTEAQLQDAGRIQVWRLSANAIEAPFSSRSLAWIELREALEDAKEYGRRKGDFEANKSRAFSLSRVQLEALQPVLRAEQTVVIQVSRAADIEAVLRLADTYGLKIVLAGATEAWVVREELARRKTPVILDPNDNLPDDFDSLRVRNDAAALLQSAGVPVMFTTSSSNNGRQLWQRAGNAVRYGMNYEAALRGLTEVPAEVFQLPGLGRIAPGAQADLVVWSGMPLEIASQAEVVFIAGQRTSLITRQTLLLERYRQVPPVLPVLPRAEGGR